MNSLISEQTSKMSKIKWLLLIAFLLGLPLVLQMPPSFSWENGPLEMAQNIVLFINVLVCLYFFSSTSGKKTHYLWLNSAFFHMILLGRELNWGRVFFLKKMTDHGPVFYRMNELTNASLVHGLIGLSLVEVLFFFWKLVPWKLCLQELPKLKDVIGMLFLFSVLSKLGDKGYLFHSYIDEAIEEYAELFLYIFLGYVTVWYYHVLKKI